MESIIPLWVEGRLVWITGLTKRTTCSDVITSVINFQGSKVIKRHYKLIERWRWMERHLAGRCKILRVWQSWSEERKNVYFLLKKRASKSEESERRLKMARHGSKSHRRMKLKQDVMDREELKHILRMQQEALSIQQEKLEVRESEIEEYETFTHLSRIKYEGENYLQDIYLGNDGNQSSNLDETSNVYKNAVREATLLYERILEISRRIEKQEKNIRLLSAQIRYSISVNENALEGTDDNLVNYLQKTKIRSECLAALNETQKLAIQQNERTLEEYEKILSQKRCYVEKLHNDLKQRDFLDEYQWGIHRDDGISLSSLPSSWDDSSVFLNTLV